MLLRLRKELLPDERASVLTLCRGLGYSTRWLDARQTLLELEAVPAAGADPSANHRSIFEDRAAIAEVLDASDAPELFAATSERSEARIDVAEASFGAGHLSLIAGPCAVEDEARLIEIAHAVRARGATLLRGGAFKPRTSPYSFQGLGADGLAMLAAARAETGLGVVTEVLDPRNVEAVNEVADAFQVGSRGMANSPLLRELGKTDKPVLLKRGMAATVREFLLAAEYVLDGGNERVILCERGVRGFDRVTRNLLDVGAVAHLKRATWLPVIVDPSHAAGRADLVRPLARAGLGAGADGLSVEVHPAPCEVRSDGAQALSFQALEDVATDARALARVLGKKFVEPRLDTVTTAPAKGASIEHTATKQEGQA